ncbi:hypothetical protein HDU76_001371 [Blyttiomyces sp. JEL0837]|nr:hypothetical protein HDU76_001371 [Blyttiomyces sp. JEL0837]
MIASIALELNKRVNAHPPIAIPTNGSPSHHRSNSASRKIHGRHDSFPPPPSPKRSLGGLSVSFQSASGNTSGSLGSPGVSSSGPSSPWDTAASSSSPQPFQSGSPKSKRTSIMVTVADMFGMGATAPTAAPEDPDFNSEPADQSTSTTIKSTGRPSVTIPPVNNNNNTNSTNADSQTTPTTPTTRWRSSSAFASLMSPRDSTAVTATPTNTPTTTTTSTSTSFFSKFTSSNASTPVLPLPDHRRPESLLPLLESIKGFMRSAQARDMIQTVLCRDRFETRLEKFQVSVRSWMEDLNIVASGVVAAGSKDPSTISTSSTLIWDDQDKLDRMEDLDLLEEMLVEHVLLVKGDEDGLSNSSAWRNRVGRRLSQRKSMKEGGINVPSSTSTSMGISSFLSKAFYGSSSSPTNINTGVNGTTSTSNNESAISARQSPSPTSQDSVPHVLRKKSSGGGNGSRHPGRHLSTSTTTSSNSAGYETDDEPVSLAPVLGVPRGSFVDAVEYVERCLDSLEVVGAAEAEAKAVFDGFNTDGNNTNGTVKVDGNGVEVKQDGEKVDVGKENGEADDNDEKRNQEIDRGLLRKWILVVLESLKGQMSTRSLTDLASLEAIRGRENCNGEIGDGVENNGSLSEATTAAGGNEELDNGVVIVNPYDLDDDGDGNPLGPAGLGESQRATICKKTGENGGVTVVEVVVKKLRVQLRPEQYISVFKRDILAWSKLRDCPNILRIYGYSSPTTSPALIITPYLKNGDILTYTRSHPGHSLRLLHETALALAFIHSHGLVHGNLRASNVLVDNQGRGIVSDGGLWEIREEAGSASAARNGWRRWLAPEVLRGPPFAHLLVDPDDPESSFDADEEEAEIKRLVVHSGARPVRPGTCHDLMWDLITACWAQDPMERPAFAAVEAKLKHLLRLQSSFRRQSQIKTRAEAFLVEVPLGDLMGSVVGVGRSGNGVSGGADREKSGETDSVDGSDYDAGSVSAYGSRPNSRISEGSSDFGGDWGETKSSASSSKISVNLAFSLDGIVGPPHPSSVTRLGIDLPPTPTASVSTPVKVRGETVIDQTQADEDAELDEYEETDLESPSWLLWVELAKHFSASKSTDDASTVLSTSWDSFVGAIIQRYPTIVPSAALRRQLDPKGTDIITYQSQFHKYVTARSAGSGNVSPSPSGNTSPDPVTTTTSDVVIMPGDFAFSGFCMASDANRNPVSHGPIDESKVREFLAGLPGCVVKSDMPLLHVAATAPGGVAIEVVKMLVRVMKTTAGGQGNWEIDSVVDSRGWTALQAACKVPGAGTAKIVEILVREGGAKVGRPMIGKGGWTALHVACWVGALGTVKSLVDALVDGNAKDTSVADALFYRDSDGWSPLMHSARYGHSAVVKLLIDTMVAANLKDSEKWKLEMKRSGETAKTALELAKTYGFDEVVSILEGSGFTS